MYTQVTIALGWIIVSENWVTALRDHIRFKAIILDRWIFAYITRWLKYFFLGCAAVNWDCLLGINWNSRLNYCYRIAIIICSCLYYSVVSIHYPLLKDNILCVVRPNYEYVPHRIIILSSKIRKPIFHYHCLLWSADQLYSKLQILFLQLLGRLPPRWFALSHPALMTASFSWTASKVICIPLQLGFRPLFLFIAIYTKFHPSINKVVKISVVIIS